MLFISIDHKVVTNWVVCIFFTNKSLKYYIFLSWNRLMKPEIVEESKNLESKKNIKKSSE